MTPIIESISGIDYGTYYHFRENTIAWLNLPTTILAYAGSIQVLGLLTAAIAIRYWLAGGRARAVTAVVVFAVTLALAEAIRPIAAIPPPLDAATAGIRSTAWSFPSLHAALSLAVFLNLALEVPKRHRPIRWLAMFAALTMSCAVAFAVIYLRVHWVSDVLGGWVIALSAVAIVRHLSSRQSDAPGK